MLAKDIRNRIKRDFNADEQHSVESLLLQYAGKEPDRVIRCIIHLSNGSYHKLKHNYKTANDDYRDIIFFAEYDEEDRRINDFTQPFSE